MFQGHPWNLVALTKLMSTMKALISILAAGPGLLYLVSGESHKHIKSVFLLLLFFPFRLLLSFILQFIIHQFSHSWPILWTFSLFSLFRKDRNILHIGCSVWVFVYFCFQCWQNGNPKRIDISCKFTHLSKYMLGLKHIFLHCQSHGFILFFVTILHYFFPLQSTFWGHDFHYITGNMTAIFFLQHWQKLIKKKKF